MRVGDWLSNEQKQRLLAPNALLSTSLKQSRQLIHKAIRLVRKKTVSLPSRRSHKYSYRQSSTGKGSWRFNFTYSRLPTCNEILTCYLRLLK
ncbi:hypothetical protein EVAR_88857_1 [Eumeta japonica]|uniref:Uncharacterized protein n=1 Tax=Eumeta variegata TaxID=151549 RepID=A0A4C1Y784_EUMVA|nr:hypothetical protein EVAR_88857_1 [Eumeta japonica]